MNPDPATTVKLPHVSIGGYSARLRDLDLDGLGAEFMAQHEKATRLTRELAAAKQRADLAWLEIRRRTNDEKEAA